MALNLKRKLFYDTPCYLNNNNFLQAALLFQILGNEMRFEEHNELFACFSATQTFLFVVCALIKMSFSTVENAENS